MLITLTPEQEAWLQSHVASGAFASIEEAVSQSLDERIAERELEDDDLAWAKPLVDEGLAALERGEFISLEEHKARNAARRIRPATGAAGGENDPTLGGCT